MTVTVDVIMGTLTFQLYILQIKLLCFRMYNNNVTDKHECAKIQASFQSLIKILKLRKNAFTLLFLNIYIHAFIMYSAALY